MGGPGHDPLPAQLTRLPAVQCQGAAQRSQKEWLRQGAADKGPQQRSGTCNSIGRPAYGGLEPYDEPTDLRASSQMLGSQAKCCRDSQAGRRVREVKRTG